MNEIHPLDRVSADCSGFNLRTGTSLTSRPEGGPDARVAGVMHKWTNFGKGWQRRWFLLRGGILSYSKAPVWKKLGAGTRVIGDLSVVQRDDGSDRRKQGRHARVVHVKISSFRESKSDNRRFYIFSSKGTLYLKTDSREDRVAWIEALTSSTSAFSLGSLNELVSVIQNQLSLSTEKLRKRLAEEGLNETLIKDCEQIVQTEFSQFKTLHAEHLRLFTLRKLEDEAAGQDASETHLEQLLLESGFSSFGNGKHSEYTTTESSEDVERQELDGFSEEDGSFYFDAHDSLGECNADSVSVISDKDCIDKLLNSFDELEMAFAEIESGHGTSMHVERRRKLPDPVEKEKGVSLWSIIKDNVGKDLTSVCLPVYFNEPLSTLQKSFEDLEYSSLLDKAYEYGKLGNSLMRILNVAAFAVSGYASTEDRPCKPFNPMLGETYEADYPEKGIRFFSEKVSHHPMLIACHCEGRGWKFWGDSNLKSKFWGRSIQLDPVGLLTLEFDDGEIFQWSKVTTSIYNLILGKIYCDHHGVMFIQGNRQHSCKLIFKEKFFFDKNPHQVEGYVEDINGTKVASLMGKWSERMYYTKGDRHKSKLSPKSLQNATLLWEKNKPPPQASRYNLSSFAITLNEITPELQEKLPPTDSRRRPDQRHLENGEYGKANEEKLRLEKRQRMSKKLQEKGWKPRWFKREGKHGTYCYIGGYWEAREAKRWDGCPDIFSANCCDEASISPSN